MSGIYSPERNIFLRLAREQVRYVKKSNHIFSRIHVADIAQVLSKSLIHSKPGEIYNFYVDGNSKKITSDIDNSLWTIANQLLKKKLGTWWNDGPGANFSVTIWGDDIFIDGFWKEHEYQDSGVNLKVTLNNIEEFEG